MGDSLFRSALRAILVACGLVLGVALGLVLLMLAFGVFSSQDEDDKVVTTYSHEILPNAEGKRVVLSESAPVILQIDIHGVIGLDELDAPAIRQRLVESREGTLKSDRVKGIFLSIQTPGGTVVDADGIYHALKEYKEKYHVPVYAYVDGLSTSGGVYVSLAADQIYASDVSVIGSVGVIAPTFMNFSKLMEKVGVDALTIYSGKGKDELNPLRPWKENEGAHMKNLMQYYYDHFVALVVQNRPQINRETLINVDGAQIFPAAEALKKGFIDVNGASRETALHALVAASGISGEYQVIRLDDKNWLKKLLLGTSALSHGKIEHTISLPSEIPMALRSSYLYYCPP